MVKDKVARPSAAANKRPAGGKSNGAVLIIAALDMSWRLALVVLVPIIGGFKLDEYLGITPALTIVGFLLAMVGLFVVLKRTVATADDRFKPRGTRE